MPRKKIKQHHCANCGFQFSADTEHTNFCPNCGQENHNPRFPLVHYGYELLEGLFHFDTKFFYSLKVLLFRPGKITYDYIHNVRGRYTPPFRMFIFLSIGCLLVMGLYETKLLKKGSLNNGENTNEKNMTIGEIFDRSPDTLRDNILAPPFSWVMKNPNVSYHELRLLKKKSKDSVGYWLAEHGYSNNIISRLFAINKKIRISREMTTDEVVIMVTGIFKWLFLIMLPVIAFICFLFFYRKGLFYYDTMLFSIHFGCFFLILFSVLLTGLLLPFKNPGLFPIISGWLFLLLLIIYLAASTKKVFGYNWLNTILRLVVTCMLTFTVYQLAHYIISNHSGR